MTKSELSQLVKLEKLKGIKVSVLDSKTIELFTSSVSVEEVYKKVKLEPPYPDIETEVLDSIIINGSIKISVGDRLETKLTNTPNFYEVFVIIKVAKNKFVIKTDLITKTSIYLLPCLGFTKKFCSWDNYLVNVYLDGDDKKLHLLYRFFSDDSFIKTEARLIKHPEYVSTIDLSSEYVAYRFHVPDKFHADVTRFVEGQYSKFSILLKRKIITFHIDVKEYRLTNLYGVLNKSDFLK